MVVSKTIRTGVTKSKWYEIDGTWEGNVTFAHYDDNRCWMNGKQCEYTNVLPVGLICANCGSVAIIVDDEDEDGNQITQPP